MDSISGSVKQVLNFVSWIKTAKIVFFAVYLVLIVAVVLHFNVAEIQGYIDQHRHLAVLLSTVVIFISALTFIPTIPLTVFTTVLLGPVQSMITTTLATTLAALVHYQLGKQIGDVVHFHQKKTRLPFNLGRLPINSPIILLLGRIIPGGPTGLSFLCGAYRVPVDLYLWTTILMSLLGSAVVAFGGFGLISL